MAGPVDLILLRGVLAQTPLLRGAVLHARVADTRTLIIDGVRIAARLPDGVESGQRLRLVVEEASGERVHLRIVEQPAVPPQPPAAPLRWRLELPGGSTARVEPGEQHAVSIRYDSPALGRLDIRLDAAGAAVHVSAGTAEACVRAAAGELRAALDRPVTIHPRDETLDLRA